MCIIVYKPKNVELPDEEILHTCFDNNDDGAGFMRLRDGKIVIRKGFMTWKHFIRAYKQEHFTKKDAFVLHFRIASHGVIDEGSTHPFPVTTRTDNLKKRYIKTDFALVHNGILDIKIPDKKLSDTMEFVRSVVSGYDIAALYKDKDFQKALKDYTSGSRMLYWSALYGIWRTGSWVEDGGIFYSNSSYKEDYSYIISSPYDDYGYTSRPISSTYEQDYGKSLGYGECEWCGNYDDLIEYDNWNICEYCRDEMRNVQQEREEIESKYTPSGKCSSTSVDKKGVKVYYH